MKLKDLSVNIFSGGTPSTTNEDFWNGEFYWLSSGETKNAYIRETEKTITKLGVEKSSTRLAKVGDVVIASAGQGKTRGQVAYCLTDTYINQSVIAIRTKEELLNSKFLFYNLTSRYNELRLLSDSSSSRGSLTVKIFEELNINLPKIEDQKKIAKVLSNYDDLIENNNKRIKILEEMAQKIYKEWFVDFKFPNHETATFKQTDLGEIPSDWEFIELQKILSLQHGYAFKSSQFSDNKTNKILVRMGNFQSYGGVQFEDNTKYLVDGEQYQEKYVLNAKDLVMVLSDVTREGRIIGNVGFIPEDDNIYLLNQRVARINTNEKYKQYLILLFNSKIFKSHCLSRADSATVLNLSNDDIYDYKISLPNDSILSKFNRIISPILKEIAIIISKNQTLKQTRDLLLPRLISGEIDVENMEIK